MKSRHPQQRINPVRGYTMLNFINWLKEHHPEVKSIRETPQETLLALANDFEEGNLEQYPMLADKWKKGFNYLLNDTGIWQGYDQARAALPETE